MTLDEARLMANVNHWAGLLFAAGYRARWTDAENLEIRNGTGATYLVDTKTGTCDCPFYKAHQGRLPCKHSLGARLLLSKQRDCRRLVSLLLLRVWADLDDRATARVPEGCRHG